MKDVSYFEQRCTEDESTGCWNWDLALDKAGYGKATVDYVSVRAHRGSWEAVHGPVPEGMVVCHKCDNPRCVNPSHLFLGTQQDNMTDKVTKGRQAKGSKVGPPKLKEHDVSIIKWCLDAGVQGARLARLYGVSSNVICRIRLSKLWKHVAPAEYSL